jgi:hypothetical protein
VSESCLDRPAAELGNFHLYPLSLSLCLKKLVRTLTPAPGLGYRLTLTLCQPLSLSYFGSGAYQAESSIGGRSVIVSPVFDGHGGGPPS